MSRRPGARVALVLLALLLAGCATRAPLDAARCSTGDATGIGADGGVNMTVSVLHDGVPSRDVVVCIRLDEHDQFGVEMHASDAVPNMRTAATGRYPGEPGDAFRVGASILDDDQADLETFTLTETNVVVVVVGAGYTLRIDKHDQPVGFM